MAAKKKAPAKKASPKKAPAKKPTAKKAPAKKPTAKKPTAKKPTAKKPTAKKPTAKKPTAKKAPAKKVVSAVRSEAAKKVWARRKRLLAVESARIDALTKARSDAAKNRWEQKKLEAQRRKREPMLVRKDLTAALPKVLDRIERASQIRSEENLKKIIKEERAKLKRMKRSELINAIRHPAKQARAEKMVYKDDVYAIALEDMVAFWEAQVELLSERQAVTKEIVREHFEDLTYGSEMEVYKKVDEVFHVLSLHGHPDETEESRLRRTLNQAYATPHFDAIARAKAAEMHKQPRQIYAFYFGSPDADLFE